MKKGVKKCLLITVCILNFQMCMFSYATARESTPNIKVNRSKSRNVYMKIISATPKTIKIKIFNKSENIARYSESFTLYKYKDGKYKKIKKIAKEKQKNREKVLQKSKFCCILWVSHIFFTTQAYGGEQT